MVRRLRPGLLSMAVAAALLAGCGGGGTSSASGKPTSHQTASASESSGGGRYQPAPEDFRAVAAVLGRRARAIRADDLHGFLATVDRSNHDLVTQQRTLFANMTGLPLASLRYAVDRTAPLVPARIAGHDPVLHPDITEFLRLASTMDRPVTNSIHETFVRRHDRWVLGAEPRDSHGVQWRPWGGPSIASLRRGPMTVIVDRSRASTLPSLSQAIHDDIGFDAAKLGVPAAYQVVVDATSSGGATAFSSLSKEEAAAVTFPLVAGTRESPDVGRRQAGLAIKVNPHDAAQISASTPVLRHELTHYLLRQFSGAVPTWLSEGIATWIQYYPDYFGSLGVSSAFYNRLIHAERVLPSIGLFNDDPEVNYLVSQAAVAWLVSHYGMPRLIALMRAYRDNFRDVNSDAITPRMLRQEYGVTERQVIAGAFGLIGSLRH